jgi:hypothetical protein
MKLIDECKNIKYYEGFDVNEIKNHPTDGSKGLMVVFFESLDKEEQKYERSQKISNILNNTIYTTFNNMIDNLTNDYLIINETKGYTDVIYRSIRSKMETKASWYPVAGQNRGFIPNI